MSQADGVFASSRRRPALSKRAALGRAMRELAAVRYNVARDVEAVAESRHARCTTAALGITSKSPSAREARCPRPTTRPPRSARTHGHSSGARGAMPQSAEAGTVQAVTTDGSCRGAAQTSRASVTQPWRVQRLPLLDIAQGECAGRPAREGRPLTAPTEDLSVPCACS